MEDAATCPADELQGAGYKCKLIRGASGARRVVDVVPADSWVSLLIAQVEWHVFSNGCHDPGNVGVFHVARVRRSSCLCLASVCVASFCRSLLV